MHESDKPIWQPSEQRKAEANITRFIDSLDLPNMSVLKSLIELAEKLRRTASMVCGTASSYFGKTYGNFVEWWALKAMTL